MCSQQYPWLGGFNLEYGDLEKGNLESQSLVLSDPTTCPQPTPNPLTPLQPPHIPPTPTYHPHPHTDPHTHPGGSGKAPGQGFFEIKFEITVSRRQISRKSFSRLQKSVFEINDFSAISLS